MVPEPVEGIGGASTSSATEKFKVQSLAKRSVS